MELRPYQVEAVKAIENEWKTGKDKTLLVLPTGGGKTITFGQIAYDMRKYGIILENLEPLAGRKTEPVTTIPSPIFGIPIIWIH